MQFLISVIDDGQAEAAGATESATDEEMDAVGDFNRRLQAAGTWLFAGGLSAPADAVVVDDRGAETIVSPGPFAAASQFVAGLWLWEVDDRDEALQLAAEASRACNRKIEVRGLLGPPERG